MNSLYRVLKFCFSRAEPLNRTDANSGVKSSGTKRQSLPHIGIDKVSLNLSFRGYAEHPFAYIHPDPFMPMFCEDTATDSGTAANF